MKASDLRIEELISFDNGFVSLHGRRLILHDLHAFAQFRKDLIAMTSMDDTRRILTRFGYFSGQADAAAMKRLFNWDSVAEWLRAGVALQSLEGVAKASVQRLELDTNSNSVEMEVIWNNSAEASEHLSVLGPAHHPVCWILTGYASGYATFCLKRNIYFIETACLAKGDRTCRAIGRTQEAWGEEIEPHLAYFELSDIHKEIRDFSENIRRKEELLEKNRRRIDRLERRIKSGVMEIHSARFRDILELAMRVAPYDTSILITGESGTGKEVLARHIHDLSLRKQHPLVAINCAALPETLLESELFGHKAGAFTGATNNRSGLFEEASGGTIFLDEIGDVSPGLQMKLLRVLQEREIIRVGENKPRKVDVRVIAATNRDLDKGIREGQFREDLLYRLRVIEIEVPPLRERREDIPSLARHFVTKYAKRFGKDNLQLDATCLDYLIRYPWPGNVRELENAMERAAVLCHDQLIRPEDLPPSVLHGDLESFAQAISPTLSLKELEMDHIRRVLQFTSNNKAEASRILGISTATLWRKLKDIGKAKK